LREIRKLKRRVTVAEENSILTRHDFETLRFQLKRFKSVTLEKGKREKLLGFAMVYHHSLSLEVEYQICWVFSFIV